MLALDHVTVDLSNRCVVDDVTLQVARGEWVSLLGPNGAGKTTILRAIAGVVGYAGEISVSGRPLRSSGRRERSRLVALVPQTPLVPLSMSVGEYVLLGRTPFLTPLGREGTSDRSAAGGALARLGLGELARRALGSLSGGELQRAVIARALAQDAPVLLLDEPTTALDLGHQQQVLDLVDELRRENGLTVVAALHDLTLASQYGDRVALLDAGRIVADGDADEVLTEERLEQLYRARVRVLESDGALAVIPVRT